jgi:hypothetical protein
MIIALLGKIEVSVMFFCCRQPTGRPSSPKAPPSNSTGEIVLLLDALVLGNVSIPGAGDRAVAGSANA